MPWFQVDDQLPMHRKVVMAGNAAMGLWVRAGSWSMQNLTGGFIPNHVIRSLGTMAQAKALVFSGLWHRADGGCRFHDWDEHQLSVEELEARKRKRQEAGRRGGQAKALALAKAAAKREPEQVLKQNSAPVLDPLVVTSGGDVTQAAPSEPPPCNDHPENPEKPCRKCQRRREWEQEQDALAKKTAAQDRVRQRQTAVRTQLNCPDCDDYGWLIGDFEPPEKCSRHPIVKPEAV